MYDDPRALPIGTDATACSAPVSIQNRLLDLFLRVRVARVGIERTVGFVRRTNEIISGPQTPSFVGGNPEGSPQEAPSSLPVILDEMAQEMGLIEESLDLLQKEQVDTRDLLF